MRNPLKIDKSLEFRKKNNSLRSLNWSGGVDFSSNDYLGFATSREILSKTAIILEENNLLKNGSTGSRLLYGNYDLYENAENFVARFHHSEAGLIFNSGYDANLGFFSSVPQKGDVVFYDEYIHASIRDGLLMSRARSFKFRHNDIEDLQKKLHRLRKNEIENFTDVFIATEAIFSMDGDIPDLNRLSVFAEENNCFLVIDEAHSIGLVGDKGAGLVPHLGVEDKVFARIVTFGKALGVHGAAILGSSELKKFLVNYARSFIYTTALPPHSIASILAAYQHLEKNREPAEKLLKNINLFRSQVIALHLENNFLDSKTAIQSCIVPGNDEVKELAKNLVDHGFNIKPVLSPTVPKGKERLRLCLHSFNTEDEIKSVLKLIATFIK